MKRAAPGFALALALGLSGEAIASAYYFSDIGVRGFARGGAFIAGADDLTALYYNPAALTRLERPQIMLNVAGVQQSVNFQRTNAPGLGAYDAETGGYSNTNFKAIENTAPPFAIPHFGFSSKLGTPNTTFAFGFYPPYAPDLSYDEDGPQRYSLIDTMVIQTSLGPSVAHKLNDWISVGAGVAWGVLIAEQQLKISVPWNQDTVEVDFSTLDVVNNTGPNEDPANDVGFDFKASDWGGVSWNAGLMIEPPSQKWAFGLMVQPPVKFHAKGKMQADFSNHVLHTDGYLGDQIIVSEKVSDDDVTLNILMPLILKAGFAVRPTETSEIELAGVWQNWSRIETMTITGLNLVVDVNGDHMVPAARRDDTIIDDDVVLPTYYEDAWSVRLGGQNHFGAFTARAGMFYETSAIPTSTQNVSLVDGNKVGYGVGGSYRPSDNWSIDLGLSQSFLAEKDVSDSEIEQIAVEPLTGDFIDGTIIGNGTYTSSVLIFGAGLNYYFGS